MFAGSVTAIGEAQLKTWLIEWDRSLKTKANYHGLKAWKRNGEDDATETPG